MSEALTHRYQMLPPSDHPKVYRSSSRVHTVWIAQTWTQKTQTLRTPDLLHAACSKWCRDVYQNRSQTKGCRSTHRQAVAPA